MSEVLVGVGGGIAAYKAAALVSRLVQDGHGVRVALTPRAREFVGALTFEGLSGRPAILSPTQVDADGQPPHIAAAAAAQVGVVAPCTADLLARMAAGLCDDAVSLLSLTVRCPMILCPAMNDAMWESPAVRDNARRLEDRGFRMLGPVVGHLAEGYDAVGRMVEPEEIAAAVAAVLAGR